MCKLKNLKGKRHTRHNKHVAIGLEGEFLNV
jgi:hypothetical protein